jgi:transcriptional regulator with XRE-family HTH domain
MTNDAGSFGTRLRSFRLLAALSQEELAERSGVSVRTIGNMERGRARKPHRSTCEGLADALGCVARRGPSSLPLGGPWVRPCPPSARSS